MKVKSFGCSFIFGNELPDDGLGGVYATPSHLTWPALIAKNLSADYQCYAKPGSGNLQILERIMQHAGTSTADDFFIIQWTWMQRFDHVVDDDQNLPWREKWNTISPTATSPQAELYYQHLHSEFQDKLVTLIYIETAVAILQRQNIPFLMTCIDDLIFDRTWHAPISITQSQDYLLPFIRNFEGFNFLSWSQRHHFPIGEMGHPLQHAHRAAAELMYPLSRSILRI